jgi:hypothetical protein
LVPREQRTTNEEDGMVSREEGHRRTRTTTIGLAAVSLVGTAMVAVTVAVQPAQATDGPSNSTDSTNPDGNLSPDQAGTGFTPPDGTLNNGGSIDQGGSGTTGRLPQARSGGSR